MSTLAPIRPRFTMSVPGTTGACTERLRAAFDDHPDEFAFRVVDHHVDVTVPKEHRHRWSPCVHLELLQEEGGRVEVHGLIGPHPNVWTFYAVITLHFVLVVAFAVPFGLVQMSLDHTPWALWIALGGLLGVGGMYLLSQFGRRLARDETASLMAMVEEALAVRAVPAAPEEPDQYS